MKRYFMRALNLVVQAVADKDGPWVRFEDAEAAEARVMELENGGMRTGALPDWTKHNHPAQLAIREQARRAEAAEAKLAELERGEYICKRCLLRKDSDFTPGDF